jgi:hypothetical protein
MYEYRGPWADIPAQVFGWVAWSRDFLFYLRETDALNVVVLLFH